MTIRNLIYGEFIYVFLDYFSVLKKNEACFELLCPLLISVFSAVYAIAKGNGDIQYKFIQDVVPFIGTLLGFTLAALTLLLSNARLEEKAQQYSTKRTIRGVYVSMYKLIVVFYSYLIICETFLCATYYVASLFPESLNERLSLVANTAFIVGVFHILLATIRTVTIMYFVTVKQK